MGTSGGDPGRADVDGDGGTPASELDGDLDRMLEKAVGASVTVALTVVDCSSIDRDVLVGVRSPLTNVTHPGVISTPTQRIPRQLVDHLCADAKLVEADERSLRFDINHAPVRSQTRESRDHPLRYVVECLLTRKLGVADALETGKLAYRASLGSLTLGVAHYPNLPESDASERILMPNILVAVDRGMDCFPPRTASYDQLTWVHPKTLQEAMRTKDVFLVFPHGDPVELCIYGMCVTTTTELLASTADEFLCTVGS